MESHVADLTPEQVGATAPALGLPMTPDDLAEVTQRLTYWIDLP